MSKMLNENLGTVDYDELIIGNFPVADVVMVKLAGGQGVVKRGTVVTGDPGGETVSYTHLKPEKIQRCF